jgi:hypothetical protein
VGGFTEKLADAVLPLKEEIKEKASMRLSVNKSRDDSKSDSRICIIYYQRNIVKSQSLRK